jgi:hypothetical protein
LKITSKNVIQKLPPASHVTLPRWPPATPTVSLAATPVELQEHLVRARRDLEAFLMTVAHAADLLPSITTL